MRIYRFCDKNISLQEQISDPISVCEREMAAREPNKAKPRAKRFHFVAQPTTTAPVPDNSTTHDAIASSDLEEHVSYRFLLIAFSV